MADFNPPDSHWAGDFDARLLGTFHHLLERIEALEVEMSRSRNKDKGRDAALAQAVRDARHVAREQGGRQ